MVEGINADQTIARVLPLASKGKRNDNSSIDARIIGTPAIHAPLDVANLTGILFGEVRSPIGVLLVEKDPVEFDVSHDVNPSLYADMSAPKEKNRDRVITQDPGDNQQQLVSRAEQPHGHMVVVKPRKKHGSDEVFNTFLNPSAPDAQVDDRTAYMSVAEDEARLVADRRVGIIVNSRNGTTIDGPVNLGASMEDVRIGGAWRFNPMMKYQIPSTAVTPIPALIYDPPANKLLDGIDKHMENYRKAL